MKKNKKAALELSINAIVIVVLAMTLLGLGLGFVRNMISGIGETTFSVQEQVKQQILDDLRRGDKKLSFPSNEITISLNDEYVFAIGIRNTGDKDINFNIVITDMDDNWMYGDEENSFMWDYTLQKLRPQESNVYPIKIFSPENTGTYMYKLRVVLPKEVSVEENSYPTTAYEFGGILGGTNHGETVTTEGFPVYTEKSFFVNIR